MTYFLSLSLERINVLYYLDRKRNMRTYVCILYIYIYMPICTIDFPSQWTIRRLSRAVPGAKIAFSFYFPARGLSPFFPRRLTNS